MRNTRSGMRVVSLKLPEDLERELTRIARRLHTSRSAVLREALEAFARGSRRSVTAAAGELVGSLHGPRDLSTKAGRFSSEDVHVALFFPRQPKSRPLEELKASIGRHLKAKHAPH